jgi:hypothetical protein
MNPYEKLMARKRKWTPVQTEAGKCRDGAEETIYRALALRHMELPVGDFITLALQKAWIAHPDHVVTKAMVAERAIFFVLLPFFRANGDAGMRTVSADISRDEQVHVATNSLVCRELNLDISPSLDKLRKATINWVMQPLTANDPVKFLDKKFWLDSSDRLMYEGKAPELSFTRSARMPAFFEHSNVNLPQYA